MYSGVTCTWVRVNYQVPYMLPDARCKKIYSCCNRGCAVSYLVRSIMRPSTWYLVRSTSPAVVGRTIIVGRVRNLQLPPLLPPVLFRLLAAKMVHAIYATRTPRSRSTIPTLESDEISDSDDGFTSRYMRTCGMFWYVYCPAYLRTPSRPQAMDSSTTMVLRVAASTSSTTTTTLY